ncbi:MAG: 7-cyano-7-deazaguanine synthase [Nanoarchaeota archaeon]|nr:7-cyano-7-deazaguanine synthase [Nanoarchaeota archaeon]
MKNKRKFFRNAIILCSGGVDSVTTAYYVKKRLNYKDLIVLFFDYGQKSIKEEKKCSKVCSRKISAKFVEMKLPELKDISNSLINKQGNIKKVKRKELKDTKKESLKWYVPYRNAIFLVYALAMAEALYMKKKNKYDIFVGFKSEGRGGYPDTSQGFLNSIKNLTKYSEAGNYNVKAPLMNKDKSDLIVLGKKLGINFGDTFSCYIGKNKHCGYCLACRLRQESFYWANIRDPTKYGRKMKDFRLAK